MKTVSPGSVAQPRVATTSPSDAAAPLASRPVPTAQPKDASFQAGPARTDLAARPSGGPVDVTARFDQLYAEAKAGALIRRVHAETSKQVVPMVHSSGAPELHAALVADPGLKDLIHCAVSLSGTFGGTPLATPFDKLNDKVQHVIGNLAEKIGIDTDGISDLTVANRQAYLKQHPYPSDLLTFTVATSFTKGFSFLRPLVELIEHTGNHQQSDGVVPISNQSLAGQPVAYLKDADHTDTIMHRPFSKQQPEALTIASLAYALGAAANRAGQPLRSGVSSPERCGARPETRCPSEQLAGLVAAGGRSADLVLRRAGGCAGLWTRPRHSSPKTSPPRAELETIVRKRGIRPLPGRSLSAIRPSGYPPR